MSFGLPTNTANQLHTLPAVLARQARRELATLIEPGQTAVPLALAFGTGTLLGFLPIPFVDSLLLALLLARVRRLNRPALLAGKLLWNELLVLPLYLPALRLGGRLLNVAHPGFDGVVANLAAFALGLGLIALLAAAVCGPLFVLALHLYRQHAASGDSGAGVRVALIPLLVYDRGHARHGRDQFPISRVERGQAEPDRIGGAKIGQHIHLGNQRLIYRQAVLVAQGKVRTALRAIGRGIEIKTPWRQLRRPHFLQEGPQAQRLLAHGGDGGLAQEVNAGFKGAQPEYRRCAAEKAAHTWRRPVSRLEVKQRLMPHPAAYRIPQALLQVAVYKQEGRCAGPAV